MAGYKNIDKNLHLKQDQTGEAMSLKLKSPDRSGNLWLAVLVLPSITLLHPAHAAGVLIPAANRVDEVYDSKRDIVYITNGSSITRYQVGSNTMLPPINLPGTSLTGMDISPDDNTLAVANSLQINGQPSIYLVDLPTLQPQPVVFAPTFYEGGTWSVAFGDDGAVLVSSRFNGSGWVSLRRFDPQSNTVGTIASITQDTMLSSSADRSTVGVAESNISDGRWGSYRVFDQNWMENTFYDGTGWFNYEIGVNPTGTQFSIPTYGGTYFYDANMDPMPPKVGMYAGGQPVGAAYSPNSSVVYFPWVGSNLVYAYDTNTFTPVGSYNFEYVFTWNGNHAYNDGRVKISKDGSLLMVTVGGGVRIVQVKAQGARLDTMSKNRAFAGSPDTTITINGANFTAQSQAQWNGNPLPTIPISSTQLTATIPAAILAASGYIEINIADGSTVSNPLRFYIPQPPIPAAVTALTAQAGHLKVTLAWNAAGYASTYNVYRGTAQGAEGAQPIASGLTSPDFVDTDVVNGVTYYYTVSAVNVSGIGPASNEAQAKVEDLNPPVTTAAISGPQGAGVWFTGSVQVTLGATDPDSPDDVAATYFTLDGGAQQTYAGPIAVSGDGAHTVTFHSVDKAGNVEASRQQNVNIDSTPSITAASLAGATVTITAADATSGIAATYYTLDGGPVQTYTGPVTITTSGTHTSSYWSRDNAGNVETAHTQSFTIAPSGYATVTPSIDSATSNWFGQENLTIVNTKPITALSITIAVSQTTGLTYNGQYTTFAGGDIDLGHTVTSSGIVYTYKLKARKTIPTGRWLTAAQYNLRGIAHLTAGDQYSVTLTAGGITQTFTGHF